VAANFCGLLALVLGASDDGRDAGRGGTAQALLTAAQNWLSQHHADPSLYDNFIGGKWVAPVKGQYFDVITPINGRPYTQAARSTAEDIELALDAAHAAADKWGKTAAAERANVLLKIADRIEANLEMLAYAETVDNGKPIRETLNADIPLTVDHFRYFAGCLRAQEGGISEIDETPSPTTSTSRSASSARSSRGTSRS
jgi:aldehyde dehydrogenase